VTGRRSDGVHVEQRGDVLVITLDRPEVRNAIDVPAGLAVARALDRLDEQSDIAVGVLTGAGGTFSSGMDLKAFLATGQRPEVEGRGLAGLTRTPPRKPLIAAVEGAALAGGFELVLACDLVVAATDAFFGLPEVKRGLIAGSGGLLRLPHKLPPAVAMEHALTGRTMSADEAHRWGLVNRLVASGCVLDSALDLAGEISANGPLAVQTSKEILRHVSDQPWEQAMRRQDELLLHVVSSDDAREGAAAFLERREPVWRRAGDRPRSP
jgi:enoyl-CoA hydratase